MDDKEGEIIRKYKFWQSQLPKYKNITGYWVPEYKGSTEQELDNYLEQLKKYIKPLRKTVILRQTHYEMFIKDKRNEETGHRYWRLEMNNILKDAVDKYDYYKSKNKDNNKKFEYIPNLILECPDNIYSVLSIDELPENSEIQIIIPPKTSNQEKKRRKRLRYNINKKNAKFESICFDFIDDINNSNIDNSKLVNNNNIYLILKIPYIEDIYISVYIYSLFWEDIKIKYVDTDKMVKFLNDSDKIITDNTNLYVSKNAESFRNYICISDNSNIDKIIDILFNIIMNAEDINLNKNFLLDDDDKDYNTLAFILHHLIKDDKIKNKLQNLVNNYYQLINTLYICKQLNTNTLKDIIHYYEINIGVFLIIYNNDIPEMIINIIMNITQYIDNIDNSYNDNILNMLVPLNSIYKSLNILYTNTLYHYSKLTLLYTCISSCIALQKYMSDENYFKFYRILELKVKIYIKDIILYLDNDNYKKAISNIPIYDKKILNNVLRRCGGKQKYNIYIDDIKYILKKIQNTLHT